MKCSKIIIISLAMTSMFSMTGCDLALGFQNFKDSAKVGFVGSVPVIDENDISGQYIEGVLSNSDKNKELVSVKEADEKLVKTVEDNSGKIQDVKDNAPKYTEAGLELMEKREKKLQAEGKIDKNIDLDKKYNDLRKQLK